ATSAAGWRLFFSGSLSSRSSCAARCIGRLTARCNSSSWIDSKALPGSGEEPDGVLKTVEGLVGVGERHRSAEAVMAGCSGVVVEVDTLPDGRGDEMQHLLAMVLDGVAVTAHLARHAEIDAEPRPQPLHARRDSAPLEDLAQSMIKTIRNGVD